MSSVAPWRARRRLAQVAVGSRSDKAEAEGRGAPPRHASASAPAAEGSNSGLHVAVQKPRLSRRVSLRLSSGSELAPRFF